MPSLWDNHFTVLSKTVVVMECNRSDSSHPTCLCDFRPYNGPLGNQCTIHGNHGTNIHGNHGKYNIPINDLNGEWCSDSDSASATRAPEDYSRRSRLLRRSDLILVLGW